MRNQNKWNTVCRVDEKEHNTNTILYLSSQTDVGQGIEREWRWRKIKRKNQKLINNNEPINTSL